MPQPEKTLMNIFLWTISQSPVFKWLISFVLVIIKTINYGFSCNFEFSRKRVWCAGLQLQTRTEVDSKGRLSSNIYDGKARVRVESTEDTSILEQMVPVQAGFIAPILQEKEIRKNVPFVIEWISINYTN